MGKFDVPYKIYLDEKEIPSAWYNVRETLSITDRTYLIHDGAIFLSGTPEEVAENELARKFYLGENFEWESHVKHGEESEVKSEDSKEGSEFENSEVPSSPDTGDDEIEISTSPEPEFESESDVPVPEKTEKNNEENEENDDGLLVVQK